MTVPRTTQVQPGAAVSIVLKADQRTGREVQGTVQDVLTRGDHPRGIKVRLRDGRIGRVQRMAAASASTAPHPHGPAAPAGAVRDVLAAADPLARQREQPNAQMEVRTEGGAGGRTEQRLRYRDVRLDQDQEQPEEQADLMAFAKIVPAKKAKGKRGFKASSESSAPPQQQQQQPETAPAGSSTQTATCPVCSDFHGDEAAVAHHVETHFR